MDEVETRRLADSEVMVLYTVEVGVGVQTAAILSVDRRAECGVAGSCLWSGPPRRFERASVRFTAKGKRVRVRDLLP